ncbi:MAG: hypothetical protein QXZ71_00815, partial [Candidatus Caldarchaeum sp.]
MTANAAQLTRREVERLKKQLAISLKLEKYPSDDELAQLLKSNITRKPVKTLSGVSVITVVAPLYTCPHGKCIYCPGGAPVGTPQSYTGEEAAVKTAAHLGYDPKKQVEAAVNRLRQMGHNVDKVELIIIGGTFTASPPEFQMWMIKECVDALNGVASNSLEEALRIRERGLAEEVVVVTIGPADCQQQLRTALAMGADRALHVQTDAAIEPLTAAKVLRRLVEREQPLLAILGKQAIDDDSSQTGQMLAALWGRPQATFASKVELDGDKA